MIIRFIPVLYVQDGSKNYRMEIFNAESAEKMQSPQRILIFLWHSHAYGRTALQFLLLKGNNFD